MAFQTSTEVVFMAFQTSTEVVYDSVHIHGVDSYGSYFWTIAVSFRALLGVSQYCELQKGV